MAEDLKIRQIALARVLLDDISQFRLAAQPLLIKARRLARMVQSGEILIWLGWELGGYPADDGFAVKYLERTGRLIDKENGLFYAQPLAELDRQIESMRGELRLLVRATDNLAPSLPSRESCSEHRSLNSSGAAVIQISREADGIAEEVKRLTNIRSRTQAMLREFVGATYCTLVFSRLVETIFERHHAWVDALLGNGVGDALQEIPAIYHKLSASNREAIIQALERVWNCQPLAWRRDGQMEPDRMRDNGSAQAVPTAQPAQEEILAEFNCVIRELLRVKINRTAPRRSKADLLADIRKSARENLLQRSQKVVQLPRERAARTA